MIATKALAEHESSRLSGGMGARFGLLRASRPLPQSISAPDRRTEAARGDQRHILVVEDDPSLLDIIAMTIERAGFVADKARNGEEAWTAVCNAHYDLVITDNEMPLLTGVKLIMRLRSVAAVPPCLLISGNLTSLDSMRRNISPGAVLAKPFSSIELLENIYSLLLYGGDE
jgi:CheY-like chemotaxis protein